MALRRPIRFAALLRSVACLQRAEPELSPTRTAGLTVAPPPPPAAVASAWRPPVDLLPYRAFAAPAQVKKKQNTPGEDDNTGPRVNNAITAPFVRLVTDEGHDVILRHEALQLAARLNLDLVEVQRKADPPVCKIMDFHKEKYKKEVKEKERLKTKSALVLRGRENKEVRFKGKTELKDLKVKADAITRLMERGYRVKCTAMPSGSEEEDLGGLLSRLLGLIQDVCIVESGPHLDTRHAYFIVRHAKFATKKSGKKASKAMENVGKGALGVSSETPVAASDSGDETPLQDEEWEQAESDSDVNDRAISDHVGKKTTHFRTGSSTEREGQNRGFGREFNRLKYKAGNNHDSLHNFATGGSRVNSGQGESQISGPVGSIKAKPGMEMQKNNLDTPAVEMNRYAARRQQTREDNSQSSSQGRLPQDPRRNENEGRFQMGNNQRPFQQHNWPSQPPNDGQFSQGRSPQDRRRNENERHIPLNNNQKPFQPLNQSSLPPSGGGNNATAPTTKSFGMFSTPKSANCTEQGNTNYAGSSKVANPDLPKTYGVSSSKISSDDNKSLGNKTADGPINNSSTTQKFGIFGTKRAGASNNQN